MTYQDVDDHGIPLDGGGDERKKSYGPYPHTQMLGFGTVVMMMPTGTDRRNLVAGQR